MSKFKLYDLVKLRKDIGTIKQNTKGVIVETYCDGKCYSIEVWDKDDYPFDCILANEEDLELIEENN